VLTEEGSGRPVRGLPICRKISLRPHCPRRCSFGPVTSPRSMRSFPAMRGSGAAPAWISLAMSAVSISSRQSVSARTRRLMYRYRRPAGGDDVVTISIMIFVNRACYRRVPMALREGLGQVIRARLLIARTPLHFSVALDHFRVETPGAINPPALSFANRRAPCHRRSKKHGRRWRCCRIRWHRRLG